MKQRASLLASPLLILACRSLQSAGPPASESNRGCASEFVTVERVRGVVFADVCSPALAESVGRAANEKVVGYFRPTAAMIQALENRLRPALELGRKHPETLTVMPTGAEERTEWSWAVSGAISQILEHYGEFRRQYVGIVVRGGARRVLVNSFPEVEAGRSDEFSDWRAVWVDYVDDGGAYFWRIEYDVTSGKFVGFDMNPSG